MRTVKINIDNSIGQQGQRRSIKLKMQFAKSMFTFIFQILQVDTQI